TPPSPGVALQSLPTQAHTSRMQVQCVSIRPPSPPAPPFGLTPAPQELLPGAAPTECVESSQVETNSLEGLPAAPCMPRVAATLAASTPAAPLAPGAPLPAVTPTRTSVSWLASRAWTA